MSDTSITEKPNENGQIVLPAPNEEHTVTLVQEGELASGQPYYALLLDNRVIKNRHFWNDCLWSADSRYFVIAERRLDLFNQKKLDNELLVIDLEAGRQCVVSRIIDGWITPLKIDGTKIYFAKEYTASGGVKHPFDAEIDSLELDKWSPLS